MNKRDCAALGQKRSISAHLHRAIAHGRKAPPPIEMFQVWANNSAVARRHEKTQGVLIPRLSTLLVLCFKAFPINKLPVLLSASLSWATKLLWNLPHIPAPTCACHSSPNSGLLYCWLQNYSPSTATAYRCLCLTWIFLSICQHFPLAKFLLNVLYFSKPHQLLL